MIRRLAVAAAVVYTLSACGVGTPPEPPTTASPVAAPQRVAVPSVRVAEGVGVASVVDGDTVHLRDGRTVRVLWIDTPETKDPRKPVQCFGPEASAEAHRELDGQTVKVVAKLRPDKYGRTLAALVLPDGTDYGHHMVERGFARVYEADTLPELRVAEAEARAERRGLWGPPCNGGR